MIFVQAGERRAWCSNFEMGEDLSMSIQGENHIGIQSYTSCGSSLFVRESGDNQSKGISGQRPSSTSGADSFCVGNP